MPGGRRLGTPKYYREEYLSATENGDLERRDRAIRDYYSSQGSKRDDPSDELVRDFTECQLAYERLIWRCDTTTWKEVRKKGVVKACEEWILSIDAETRFQWFVEGDLCHLTIEALVIKHSNRFREDIFVKAIRRAIRHGEKLPLEIFKQAEKFVRSHPTQFPPAIFADLKLKAKRIDSMRREWD